MLIRIDFDNHPVVFENPIKILIADTIDEVESCIHQMEAFSKQGYYVAGYLAYESAMAFNAYHVTKDPQYNQLPLLFFGVFKHFSIPVENEQKWLANSLDLTCNTEKIDYNQNIKKIRDQIKQGNTYQINYTLQFNGNFSGNAFDYYQYLRANNGANYCSYIEFNDWKILSISPELFFKLDNRKLTTKPMKGTARRGKYNNEDETQRQELFSEKNQAENMMIVDLLRNDLSHISQIGTVKVTELFKAEKYPTVWQLTSTIQSQLSPEANVFTIFKALFPCGSITGAPKASSMQIIADLEDKNREVYCGTIGYIEPFVKKAMFNIPIRTLTLKNNKVSYGVGGGITWDSTAEDEYNEVLAKTAILSSGSSMPDFLIETLLLDNGRYFLLDAHLARLSDSAQYFDFDVNIEHIKRQLTTLSQQHKQNQYKIRMTLSKIGKVTIQADAIVSPMIIKNVMFASHCMDSSNIYLYHKTSNRLHFPLINRGEEYLCYNEHNQLTEFINGNIALLMNNKWFTPPLDSGLLPGTMRQYLINNKTLTEKIIYLDQINQVEKIAFINSVRGWLTIDDKILEMLKTSAAHKLNHSNVFSKHIHYYD